MGRPSATTLHKMMATAFAKIVTKETCDIDDFVARCGKLSLYSAFVEIFPQLVRSEVNKEGISEVEFNKTLQVPYLTIVSLKEVEP